MISRRECIKACAGAVPVLGSSLLLPKLAPAPPPPAPWPQFHRDERTGVAQGVGNIDPVAGPKVRWKFQSRNL